MRRITIVDGHPDPARTHLNHALADRYAAAAQAAGHDVRRVNVAELDFPLLRIPSDFYKEPAPQTLKGAQDDIRWADHLLFFYPLWDSDMPAALKAFIEQAFRPGFALEYGTGPMGLPKRLLTRKSARIVVTMGMPPLAYRTLFGAHAVKAFRSVLRFAGVAPVHVTLLGNIPPDSSRDYSGWMTRMDALARCDGCSRAGARAVPMLAREAMLAAGVYAAMRLLRTTLDASE